MKKLILAVLTFVISTASYSQILAPVKWSYGAKKIDNEQAVVFIKATIDKGWHIYSQHVADGGPVKTSFRFDKSDDYTLNGSTIEPKAVSKYEKAFSMNVQYFEQSVIFQQKVKLKNGQASVNGTYNVSEFRINNRLLPYVPDDTLRWQNVVFEKFNTISIRVAKPFKLNTQNKIRTTEYYGNIGRLFYGYQVDTVKHVLTLKNRADTTDAVTLNYTVPSAGKFILKGVTHQKDSVYVVLNKVDKQYPLAVKRNTNVHGD